MIIPIKNIINIDGRDFILKYLDEETQGNKGGNSKIFRLFDAQEYDEMDELIPDQILKVSKVETRPKSIRKANQRFSNEVNALRQCYKINFQNVINLFNEGFLELKKDSGLRQLTKKFHFYTMEYASQDLKQFIEQNPRISIFEKTDLCLQLAKGFERIEENRFLSQRLKTRQHFYCR